MNLRLKWAARRSTRNSPASGPVGSVISPSEAVSDVPVLPKSPRPLSAAAHGPTSDVRAGAGMGSSEAISWTASTFVCGAPPLAANLPVAATPMRCRGRAAVGAGRMNDVEPDR